ncbi:MAG TPA: FTR1 family protein [Xanthobacteraceae bacterium]|jgi:high-affinity iron transporter|nr:FTR1 family protein [Xanthobacteraceae bacterium]
MLAALIIVFREVFEAGLIVGIVLAVTGSVARRGWWIGGGVTGGIIGSCIVAVFTAALSAAFEGVGQELFNAAILGIAAVMLIWHNVWMAQHGRELAREMRTTGQEVASGAKTLLALAIVVGVAVLREGVEVVLFLYGVLASGDTGLHVAGGGLVGLLLGALVSWLTFIGLLKIPSRHLFLVTSLLLAFLAAGLASQSIAFLERAAIVTALDTIVWDSSFILADSSLLGRALHTLIGYSDQPTAMQLVVYVTTLAVIFTLMKVTTPRRIVPASVTHAMRQSALSR